MNIFKKFKKKVKERNKYKRLEELFDEIGILFPGSGANLMMHNIVLDELDKRRWAIESDNTAHRQGKECAFDITLFGKDKL